MTTVAITVAPARVAAEPLRPACDSGEGGGHVDRHDPANRRTATPAAARRLGSAPPAPPPPVRSPSWPVRCRGTVGTYSAAWAGDWAVTAPQVRHAGGEVRRTHDPPRRRRTSSPSAERRRRSIRSPFTKVPLVDPRSSIDRLVVGYLDLRMAAGGLGSLTVMSQPSRPIVEPDSTPRSMPCIGSCSMRLDSLIASAPRGTPEGGGRGWSGLA